MSDLPFGLDQRHSSVDGFTNNIFASIERLGMQGLNLRR
jgi:hypothetical protein